MTRNETIFYFTLGTLNILAGIIGNEWLGYLTKPLLMLTLGVFYYQKTKAALTLQDKLMLVALLFSCLGDSFLMFQRQNSQFFLLGLGAFLVAQLTYCIIFSKSGQAQYLLRFPFVVYAATLFWLLKPYIPAEFFVPVLAYTFALTWMGSQAVERQTNPKSYRLVLIGAILFIISDSFIAVNKFAYEIPQSGVWIIATYIAAQYLIVAGMLAGKKNVAVQNRVRTPPPTPPQKGGE